jgi:hypothetical protein
MFIKTHTHTLGISGHVYYLITFAHNHISTSLEEQEVRGIYRKKVTSLSKSLSHSHSHSRIILKEEAKMI